MSPNASHRVRPGLSSAASLMTTLQISFDQEVLNQHLNLVTPEYPFFESPCPEALGDLRRRNGSAPRVLRPELLARLPERLATPPSDGGLWTGPKVAAWMGGELGLAAVLPQRGWEALKAIGWSVQKPRPRHPASATPEEREAFKKSWPGLLPRSGPSTRTRRSRSGRPTSTVSG